MKLRKDSQHTAAQLAGFVPEDGEILQNTTSNTLVVGDGATKGGVALLREDYSKRVARVTFEASDQSTAGTWDSGITIPINAIITRAWYDVITTFAGDGDDSSTIAIQALAANDILSAVAISAGGNVLDEGIQEGIPQSDDPSTYIKMTSAKNISVVVAINATDTELSAGKMCIFVEYVVSE